MTGCHYGPADETATRVGDNEALCPAHARDHYGADWRTETTAMTPRKVRRYRETGRYERA